jgi:hypothetical protein
MLITRKGAESTLYPESEQWSSLLPQSTALCYQEDLYPDMELTARITDLHNSFKKIHYNKIFFT